ncbi:MAG: hypothetical protein KatS3mg032_2459 [Cyclobacteriaceae bacterium]|nr:MAG: hypothetical protein KatS3mg032_2459 [Cyclobacteriaceae bacterium]
MCRLLILIFVAAVPCPLLAQFTNILLDSSSAGNVYPHHPSVAINLKNPDQVVVGSGKGWVYQSANRGKTWSSKRLLCPYPFRGSPVVLSDYKGRFYFVHLAGALQQEAADPDRIVVQASDDGRLWDSGIFTAFNENYHPVNPSAALDRSGTLYVTWTELLQEAGSCKSNLYFSKVQGGKKFSRPVRITAADAGCNPDEMPYGPVPAVTNDGKIFVAWAQGGKIFMDRSWDGGNTWLTHDIQLTQPAGRTQDAHSRDGRS